MPSAELVPVLVWVFGGGSVVGSPDSYGDIQSVVHAMGGKVVLVAINYRLGSFGYLALKELSATDPRGVSGNYGITDVQESLRWVQQNIASFGGDASRVTVFGQSSGGTQVLALLASPASNGLFHAAMSLSGSPNISMPLATVEDQGRTMVESVGCAGRKDVLACMYAKDTLALQALTPAHWSYEGNFESDTKSAVVARYPGLVVVDGVTVTVPIEEALASALVDVPTVFASVQAENGCDRMAWSGASDFTRFCDAQFSAWNSNGKSSGKYESKGGGKGSGEDGRDGSKSGSHIKGRTSTNGNVSAAVEALYSRTASTNASFAFATLSSDVCVTCGNAKLAVLAAGAFKSPVYLAVSTHWPSHPCNGNAFPFHTWDTTCAFATWGSTGHGFEPKPSDVAFGAAVRSVWQAMANDGVLPKEWSPVNAASGFPASYTTLLLDENITAVKDFKTNACNGLASLGLDQRYWWVN
jgi:carboxylesterase type B